MPHITYIVGNGLDLSVDMKTSYGDFYNYVDDQKLHPKNRIYKAIAEGSENWADFELAFGQYTNYIDELPENERLSESLKLHEELEDIRDDLAVYLEGESEKINERIADIVLTPDAYYNELSKGHKNLILKVATATRPVFHFVTLNFTQTLDEIIANSTYQLSSRGIGIGNLHHIHGDLSEDLTIGVSNENQLSKSLIGDEKNDLIKPALIASMDDERLDILHRMIVDSSIIILFGTSIGETDEYIWQMVSDWLSKSSQRYLIIHAHDKLYTDAVKRSSRKRKQFNSRVQEKILRHSAMDGDAIQNLRKRIFVVPNTKLLFAKR